MTPDTPWITGGGLLLVTKTYIAQMEVADLIGSRVIEFTIPTKKTGISIMAGMQGIAFGKSVEIPGAAEFAWPIYSPEGACPGINDILWTLNSTSPATRFPGTAWAAIGGRFLIGADGVYAAGSTGGEAAHIITIAEMPSHGHNAFAQPVSPAVAWGGVYGARDNGAAYITPTGFTGGDAAHNNMPPYLSVYIWKRTA